MKKIIFTIIALAIFAISCTNDMDITADFSEVTFSVDVWANGQPITRAEINNSTVEDLIESTLPTYYNIKATNLDNNNTYVFNTKTSITLPNGTYQFKTWNYTTIQPDEGIIWDSSKQDYVKTDVCNSKLLYHPGRGSSVFRNSPSISFTDTIKIERNGIVELKAHFNCSAIVWDSDIVKEITINNLDSNPWKKLECFVSCDNICITFHNNGDNVLPIDIMIYPNDDSTEYEKRTITIPKKLENGYWYQIAPTKTTGYSSEFGIDLTNWGSGGEL